MEPPRGITIDLLNSTMAKVKRVEAKVILQKNDDGHWLVVDSPSGKHAMVNIENVFKLKKPTKCRLLWLGL